MRKRSILQVAFPEEPDSEVPGNDRSEILPFTRRVRAPGALTGGGSARSGLDDDGASAEASHHLPQDERRSGGAEKRSSPRKPSRDLASVGVVTERAILVPGNASQMGDENAGRNGLPTETA
jgi:hypothetical protein